MSFQNKLKQKKKKKNIKKQPKTLSRRLRNPLQKQRKREAGEKGMMETRQTKVLLKPKSPSREKRGERVCNAPSEKGQV